MRSMRLSIRMVTLLVMAAAVAVAAVLTALLYVSKKDESQANNRLGLEIAQIAHYEDAQIALSNEGSDLAVYFATRSTDYENSFEQSRADAEAALVSARAAAPALSANEVARADDLLARYRDVSDAHERVMQAVVRDDIAGGLTITAETHLLESAPQLTTDLQATISSARTALSATRARDWAYQRRAALVADVIVLFWAAFLVVIGIAAFRWLVRPLERVNRATQSIADGDWSARIVAAGPRELSDVGENVNQMADALLRHSDELNAYLSQDLEARTQELEARTQDLERSEQRFRTLVQNGSDLITVIEPDGTIIYQSPSIERVLGHASPDVLGRKLTEFTHPDDLRRLSSFILETMKRHQAPRLATVRLRGLKGNWVHVEIAGTDQRENTAVGGLVLNIRDASERHALEERLRFDAFNDPLTRLGNRAHFSDRLEHALKRRNRHATESAVLFLDLDDFKSVNDELGHAAGDAVLTEIARRLRTCTRPEDTVARLGGDEFAVLIEDLTDIDEASATAERILSALRAPVGVEGHQVAVPASIGVAMGTDAAEASLLLRNADAAMYAAKALGKNRVALYDPAMHAAALDRLDLARDLDGAVERGEFVIEYQPIMELASGEIAGVEALVRWNHPSRGQIQPDAFVPLAEETGAIAAIGRWVLHEACRQASSWHEELPSDFLFAMNVNVSASQLLNPGFVGDVAQALRANPVDRESLVLEITESVMMSDTERSLAVLRQLKDLGVRLAIDDFGTGYSSISYLRQFPFDILKVDRSYLGTEGAHGTAQDMERALVDLGRTLKLEIVAEGIEQPDQFVRLKALHCQYGQGFYFARPLHPDHIREMLRARQERQYVA